MNNMRKTICLIILILFFPSLSFAIVNGSYEESTCTRRNSILLANALIRYKGLDTLIAYYDSNIRFGMYLHVDSVGNVKKVDRIFKTDRTPGKRQRIFLSDSEVEDFQRFLNENKIRFGLCHTYEGRTLVTIKNSIKYSRRHMYETNEGMVMTSWPIYFDPELDNFLLHSASSEVFKFALLFDHNDKNKKTEWERLYYGKDRAILNECNVQPSKRNYNSGLMMLCLSYIVGDWEIMDWLERDPFKIDVVVDLQGKPIRVLASANGETPIDTSVAQLMEDFFKSYNIRFKIPKGSMKVSTTRKEFQIAVDFPFTNKTTTKLESVLDKEYPNGYEIDKLSRLDRIFRFSQTLIY